MLSGGYSRGREGKGGGPRSSHPLKSGETTRVFNMFNCVANLKRLNMNAQGFGNHFAFGVKAHLANFL